MNDGIRRINKNGQNILEQLIIFTNVHFFTNIQKCEKKIALTFYNDAQIVENKTKRKQEKK